MVCQSLPPCCTSTVKGEHRVEGMLVSTGLLQGQPSHLPPLHLAWALQVAELLGGRALAAG